MRDVTEADARTFYTSTRWGPHNVVSLILKGTTIMAIIQDALSVPVVGALGAKVSLLDLLKQQYGEDFSTLQSVRIQYRNPESMTQNAQYWDQNNHQITKVLNGGNPIAMDQDVTVTKENFANFQIQVGNNIASNVVLSVTESTNGAFTGHFLSVTTLLSSMDLQTPANHVPTAQDIVSAAQLIANSPDDKANAPNDCHNLATAIAASAGATLDPNTDWTKADGSPMNEESGFWRINYRGIDPGAVADWQTKVQAGDIVRMERFDGGPHTATVTAGLNADGNHPGK